MRKDFLIKSLIVLNLAFLILSEIALAAPAQSATPAPAASPTSSPPVALISPTVNPQYFDPVKGEALNALMNGDPQRALDLSRSFKIDIPPGRTISREVRPERRAMIAALAAQRLGNHQEALTILSQGIALRTADPDLHYLNGLSFAAQGQLEIAQDEIQQAIWFMRKSSAGQTLVTPGLALASLGTIQSALGLKMQAQRNLAAAVALEPGLSAAHLALAGNQLDSGDSTNAIANARAAALDNHSPQAQLILARALLGTSNRAVDELIGGSKTGSQNCRAELQEAREIAKSLANDESLEIDLKNQASVVAIRAMIGCNDYNNAKIELDRFIARAPENPDALALKQQLEIERKDGNASRSTDLL